MSLRSSPRFGRHLALLALASSVGCSASLDDIRRAQTNIEYCRQNPSVREMRRNAHLAFDQMQAHTTQLTEVTLQGGPLTGRVPRARALIRPSLAASANYRPASRGCELTGPVGADGTRQLRMEFDIPDFVPPNGAANDPIGGPYSLQFWSDANSNGELDEIGHVANADHLWVRPMCDDGNVYFVHASGLDTPEMPALVEFRRQGEFRFRIHEAAIRMLESRVSIPDVIRLDPLVVEANWQGQTVAYLRTVLACDGPSDSDPATEWDWSLTHVIDPGSGHMLRMYWDANRNGEFDEACDRFCVRGQAAVPSPNTDFIGLDVNVDENTLSAWDCTDLDRPIELSCRVDPS